MYITNELDLGPLLARWVILFAAPNPAATSGSRLDKLGFPADRNGQSRWRKGLKMLPTDPACNWPPAKAARGGFVSLRASLLRLPGLVTQ